MIRPLALAALALVGLSSTAQAHFKLNTPAATMVQSADGTPQKAPPCGGNGTATNAVTNYMPGSMITIKLNETVFHPGHYRVALAQNEGSLPAEPPVTAGQTACGSTVINPNPTFPILGDGLLLHTSAFSGEQTMQVQLPAGMTCTNCVLQIIEFMSNHGLNNPGGCFYHHGAKVTISATAPDAGPSNTPDASTPGGDAGTNPDNGNGDGTGCGCSTHDNRSGALSLLAMLGIVGLISRRYR
jgi:MYXO-CTERM domain-containing protein